MPNSQFPLKIQKDKGKNLIFPDFYLRFFLRDGHAMR